jgi:hypothetical protein
MERSKLLAVGFAPVGAIKAVLGFVLIAAAAKVAATFWYCRISQV